MQNRHPADPENLLRLKKNLAGDSQSAIVHCRPLLAIPAVASVAHLRKMPANSASLACRTVLPPRPKLQLSP